MTIGILGGGQLGYMLALAGYPLGLRFRFLDPSPEAPVGRIAQRVTADFSDHAALEKFVSGLELVTYEFENVPLGATKFLAERVPVFPPPGTLDVAQNRLKEKALFHQLGISTTAFAAVHSVETLDAAIRAIGFPAVLKTCRLGYDGKGQWTLRKPADLARLKEELAGALNNSSKSTLGSPVPEQDTEPFILEQFVPFTRELSIIAVRSRSADIAFYPLVENRHREGILRVSLAPAPKLALSLQSTAEDIARRVLVSLDYAGVLAIEFFECEGRLLANEMAPRVHNSGHWTIEGAVTSQFENHLRAVLDLPLGSTAATGHSAMLNFIGQTPSTTEILAIPGAHLHLYGKTPRPGRKLGHVTLCAASFEQISTSLRSLPAFFDRPDFCLDIERSLSA
ncbi:MAG: 5-(carboxyamino)imidazole ribonucleotide synthase [Acidobacteriota bacterium]|nr:5-(carboxyamino)imidazole ribonucleotide synthase [Acidobacteriota bacterium]